VEHLQESGSLSHPGDGSIVTDAMTLNRFVSIGLHQILVAVGNL